MRKAVIVFIVLGVLLIGCCGCIKNDISKENNKKNINDVALEYMEQKYGERFEYVTLWGVSYANKDITQMLVKSSSMPDEILVEVKKSENEYTFSDNYLAVKFKKEMCESIQLAAGSTFDKSLVFYDVLIQTLSPKLSADASFEEYSTDALSGISATVVVSSEIFEEPLVKNFAKKISESGIGALIRFVVVDAEQYYSLNSVNIDEIIGQEKYLYFAVIDISNSGITINPRDIG